MVNLHENMIVEKMEEVLRKTLPPVIDVVREFQTINGRRVDLVIVVGFEILACIEVKLKLLDHKQLEAAQKQALLYQRDTHSYWTVVTDSKRFFIHSIEDHNESFVEKENMDDVLQLILGLHNGKDKIDDSISDANEYEVLKREFVEICKRYHNIRTIEKVKDVLNNVSSASCKITPTRITFTRLFENSFFQALLGTYTGDEVVRYTPFASVFRSINEQTIGMVSLVGMNDVSECYYADQYISKRRGEELSESVLPAERKLLNNTYILSCNDVSKKDDLTMWRLYGNNCKGVCIKMFIEKDKLKQDNSFILAPVSYGRDKDKHPELDFAKDILSLKIGNRNLMFETWCYWKHFFKDYRYAVEHEVRLLYTGSGCGKKSWILVADSEIPCTISIFDVKSLPNHSNDFPLTLSEIMIGSKCTDKETIKSQFEELIKERNTGYEKGFAAVEVSKIDNYR